MEALEALEDFVAHDSNGSRKPTLQDGFASKSCQNIIPKSSSTKNIKLQRSSIEDFKLEPEEIKIHLGQSTKHE